MALTLYVFSNSYENGAGEWVFFPPSDSALKNEMNNLCAAHGVNLDTESLASEQGLRAVLELPNFVLAEEPKA
jgi:hypothetical protein